MNQVIEATLLSRHFETKDGIKKAVDEVSLSINEGTIFGLLGPNGAGKSTTIKMMTTLLLPTSGELRVLGRSVYDEEHAIRPRIGFLYGGETGLYWQLSGRDNLRFFGSLFKLNQRLLEQRIDEWLERLGLTKDQHRLTMHYSKGMKQRVHIARALLHDPPIIFMDEPTLGLDPQGTAELRQIIRELKARGKTIILTTHDMEEAQELCDHIAFIMDGKVVTQGTFQQLQDQFQAMRTYQVELGADAQLLQSARTFVTGEVSAVDGGGSRITVDFPKTSAGEAMFGQLVTQLAPYGIRNVTSKQMDLRSIYLQVVGQSQAEADLSSISS